MRPPASRAPRARVLDLAHDPQHLAQPRQHVLTERRQAHPPRTPFQERRAQRALHLLYLHRQRGLADRAGIGGASEMALAGEGIEIAHLFEGEVDHKPVLSHLSDESTSPD
jgi:hypothetical protein